MTAAHRQLTPEQYRDVLAARAWERARADVLARLAEHDAGHDTVPAAVARCWRVLVAPERAL